MRSRGTRLSACCMLRVPMRTCPQMRAMRLRAPAPAASMAALELADIPTPTPGATDLLLAIRVCGVCRTDLDIAEGRLQATEYPVTPGHQVVGTVVDRGAAVKQFELGARVGVAWIHSACGECTYCRSGQENLCVRFRSTGCDAPGGYADHMVVPEAFAYALPTLMRDAELAPLLCAGAIGWRSLRLAKLNDGEPLGLTGFGASAHLVLQLARARFPRSAVHVFARSARERNFAVEMGAHWAGDTDDRPPEPLAAIIDTTPVWKPVVAAMSALRPGGRLVINAIRKSDADKSALLGLDYATALWMERGIMSVANVTRADVREMLEAAEREGIRPVVEELPLERANEALAALSRGDAVRGARVLRVSDDGS
jgi:propanol-preferring alcohol dehydrogenase